MGTLNAHLRRTDDHGGLPFHPDCPVCRAERLSGELPAHGPVGRRTQAAVVAAMLAASTATPTVAVAQEADQVTEGVVPEESGGDSAARQEFDPGGADEGLEVDEPEALLPDPAPATDDSAPPVSEPVTDSEVPVADEVAPAPTAPPPVATPSPPPSEPALQQLGQPPKPIPRTLELSARVRVKPRPVSREVPQAAAPTAGEQQVRPQAATHLATKRERGVGGSKYHVVAPGESLWSIARDVVGSDASPARIAREVNALWDINSAQIATGDPDMLRIGTRLVLR